MTQIDYTIKPKTTEHFNSNDPFDLEKVPFDISKYCIFSCISGSRAYGTSTPTSDFDKRGVFLYPELALGLKYIEQIESQRKDTCYYELRKFFSLLNNNNPHALEILYIKDSVILSRPPWDEIVAARDIFTSKRIGHSFYGYALQQLLMARTKKKNHTGRVELIDLYGYDTKLSAHCLRLLRSGTEFLETGYLTVNRPDAKELLNVKNGKYTYDDFVQWDDNKKIIGGFIKDEFDKFDKAFKTCGLPDQPDFEVVNNLLVAIQKDALSK